MPTTLSIQSKWRGPKLSSRQKRNPSSRRRSTRWRSTLKSQSCDSGSLRNDRAKPTDPFALPTKCRLVTFFETSNEAKDGFDGSMSIVQLRIRYLTPFKKVSDVLSLTICRCWPQDLCFCLSLDRKYPSLRVCCARNWLEYELLALLPFLADWLPCCGLLTCVLIGLFWPRTLHSFPPPVVLCPRTDSNRPFSGSISPGTQESFSFGHLHVAFNAFHFVPCWHENHLSNHCCLSSSVLVNKFQLSEHWNTCLDCFFQESLSIWSQKQSFLWSSVVLNVLKSWSLPGCWLSTFVAVFPVWTRLERTLCVFGSHTFVPISWMCKKQTSVSHSSTESEIISLDTGLRLDGLPALELWDLIVSVFGNVSHVSDRRGNLWMVKTNLTIKSMLCKTLMLFLCSVVVLSCSATRNIVPHISFAWPAMS